MAINIKSLMKQGADFVEKLGKKKLIIISAVGLLIITAGIIGAVMLNKPNYTVLYSNLSADEAGKIYDTLEKEGVDAKVKGSDTILVPQDQADKLRIKLAAEGYPSTGLNYDIFSGSSNLGSTDLQQQTLKQYQLQENMRTTISKMGKIKDCIVIANLPTSSSYVVSSNTSPASVSIMLQVKDGETLTNADAKSIAKFALTCVPDLKLENVSIVDSNMNSYDILSKDNNNSPADSTEYSATQQQLTEKMKGVLSNQAMNVLKPAVGANNLAVSVNLDLNFDSQSINSVEFSPPVAGEKKGLVRSSEEKYDAANGANAASGKAGTDSNGVSASNYVNANTNNNTTGSYNNTYNYELNKVETQIKKAQGKVENLSVSVLVNSNVNGITNQLSTIKGLVANAIGVDPKYITVGVMPFVTNSGNAFDNYLNQNQEIAKQYARSSLIKTAIIVGALLLMFIIAVLLIRKKKHNDEMDGDIDDTGRIFDLKADQTAGGTGQIFDATAGEPVDEKLAEKEDEQMPEEIVIKKSDEVERVEELVDKYPQTVAQILRTWLTED